MGESFDLRQRQAPLKTRYKEDPESGKTTISVRSVTTGDHPMRSKVAADADSAWTWNSAAHPMAGGFGDDPCSGDLLMAALAACQEVTLRMVASAMNIHLDQVDITVEGDMDFQGTMGTNPDTPVGFTNIRTNVHITADAPSDRLERLAQRAEKYCVVNATLRESPEMTTEINVGQKAMGNGQ
ncbi:OsmC family protein [soil metagenome]